MSKYRNVAMGGMALSSILVVSSLLSLTSNPSSWVGLIIVIVINGVAAKVGWAVLSGK